MKYKVLLLLMLATLAYCRSLKRRKTRQGDTHILNIERYLVVELQKFPDFYVFCSDDLFQQYYDFNTLLSDDEIFQRKLEEVKSRVAELQICLYNLKNGYKMSFSISEFEKPFEYSLEEGTWKFDIKDIKGNPESYIVRSRFDNVDLDFASEIIGLNIYIAALLRFRLQGIESVEIFNSLENVYKSFLYTPVIHKYYNNNFIQWRVNSPNHLAEQLSPSITKLFSDLKLKSYAVKDLTVGVFDSKDKLQTLQTILNNSSGLNIDVLKIMLDIQNGPNPGQVREVKVLAGGIVKLGPNLIDYLKSVINTKNKFFFDFFKDKSTTFEDFTLLQLVLRLKKNQQKLLLDYMDIYRALKNIINSKNCGNLKVGDILTRYKENNTGVHLKLVKSEYNNESEALLKRCVEEMANYLKNAVQELEKLEIVTKGEHICFIVKKLKTRIDTNENFITLLVDLLLNKPISGLVNENLEETSSIFNNKNLHLNESSFKIIKKLLSFKGLEVRILNAYESINEGNMIRCASVWKTIPEESKKYINAILTPKQLDIKILKTITDYLLSNEEILKELISKGSNKPNWITFKEALILDKILHNQNLDEFKTRLNEYLEEITKLRFIMRDFGSSIWDGSYIVGSKGFLKYMLKRLALLTEHFVKVIMTKRQIKG
jgi:hypothetical protein